MMQNVKILQAENFAQIISYMLKPEHVKLGSLTPGSHLRKRQNTQIKYIPSNWGEGGIWELELKWCKF